MNIWKITYLNCRERNWFLFTVHQVSTKLLMECWSSIDWKNIWSQSLCSAQRPLLENIIYDILLFIYISLFVSILEFCVTLQISCGDIFEGAPSADAIVSPANSFGFMDGGIDMVGELVLFILTDCETRYTNIFQQGKLLSRDLSCVYSFLF